MRTSTILFGEALSFFFFFFFFFWIIILSMFNSNLKIFSLHLFLFQRFNLDGEYFSIRVIFKIWNSFNKEEKCDIYIFFYQRKENIFSVCVIPFDQYPKISTRKELSSTSHQQQGRTTLKNLLPGDSITLCAQLFSSSSNVQNTYVHM